MDTIPSVSKCPRCHVEVRPTDYFCFNCGLNLKPKPPTTDLSAQLSLYLKSLLLPPMGIIWGLKYLKQSDTKSKFVGVICIVITVVELVILVQTIFSVANSFNTSLNSQLNQLQGF